MKKINNKLFQDLKLENTEIIRVIGGTSTITSTGSDTNLSNGAGYDISFDTLDRKGNSTGLDHEPTGTSDADKGGACGLQSQVIK